MSDEAEETVFEGASAEDERDVGHHQSHKGRRAAIQNEHCCKERDCHY